jgi:hypothetical protein
LIQFRIGSLKANPQGRWISVSKRHRQGGADRVSWLGVGAIIRNCLPSVK